MTDDDWQPIETAPRDGTRILVVWPNKSISIAWWWTNRRLDPRYSDGSLRPDGAKLIAQMQKDGSQASHFIDHDQEDDYEISQSENQPTHWMPLPEPPSP